MKLLTDLSFWPTPSWPTMMMEVSMLERKETLKTGASRKYTP